jgi:hypothetical protein
MSDLKDRYDDLFALWVKKCSMESSHLSLGYKETKRGWRLIRKSDCAICNELDELEAKLEKAGLL